MNMFFIRLLFVFSIICYFANPIIAQDGEVDDDLETDLIDNGNLHQLIYSGTAEDFTIPHNTSYNSINFTLRGGDGGEAKLGNCISYGGDGATVTGTLKIGNYGGQLPPGTEVRFVIGGYGSGVGDDNLQVGWAFGHGGGGSALLAKINDVWEILAVVGGGGGAYQGAAIFCVDSQQGQGGRHTTDGGDGQGDFAGNGGSDGDGGEGGGGLGSGDLSGGGGGAFSNGTGNYSKEGNAGYPAGGNGGTAGPLVPGSGGWGFGGGGAGEDSGGGGGGYSGGGGGGTINNGGGGGSYVNSTYVINKSFTVGGNISGTKAGEASYQFTEICIADVFDFEYVNPLCDENGLGRIQLDYTILGGNVCNNSFDFALLPVNGSSHLGNGIIRSVRAGEYTVVVNNTALGEVVSTSPITIEVNTDVPVAKCKNTTVNLVNGSYSNNNFANLINNGSTGFCDPVLSASRTSFNCDNLGLQIVTLTVTNSQGLSSSCEAGVTVQIDSAEQPTAKCQPTQTMNLMGGTVNINVEDIDNGSTFGACVSDISISPSSFDCDDLGPQTVTLTVGTTNNNATCTSTIIFVDNESPTAQCQEETIFKYLDANGSVTLTVAEVDNGSISNSCSDLSYSLSQSIFDCDDAGGNIITLTVTDGNGKSNSCTTNVTIRDRNSPVPLCKDVTIGLNENGTYTLDPSELDNGSSDNCAITFRASQTDFDCDDLGTTTAVTLYVMDQNKLETNCTANVSVVDNEAPTVGCFDLDIDLRGSSTSIASYISQFRALSFDNCDISSSSFNKTGFDCSEIGENEVTFQASDASGNTSSCTFTVTITDVRGPYMICQDISVTLDNTGNASITPEMIDDGSDDACSALSLSLDITSFDSDDIGDQTVTLTGTDIYGNTAFCEATVTVIEPEVSIVARCKDISVDLGTDGVFNIGPEDVDNGSTANTPVNITLDIYSFDCDDIGNNTVTLSFSDNSGNSSECQANVVVQDLIAPSAVCQNISVQIGDNQLASITPAMIDNGSSDNCSITNISVIEGELEYDCDDIGSTYEVTLQVTDAAGLSSICSADVTILSSPACDTPDCTLTEVCGNVDAWSQNQGVQNANRLRFTPNNRGARFSENDQIVVDLTHTIPAGGTYTIHWRKRRNNSNDQEAHLNVYESELGATFSFNQILATSQTNVYTSVEVVAAQDTRYLRLEHPGSFTNFLVDAVTYCTEVCVVEPPNANAIIISNVPQVEELTQDNQVGIKSKMLVYPNPSGGQIHIDLSSLSASEGTLLILNHNGQRVYQQRLDLWERKVFSLNLNEKQLPAGAYFIQYRSAQELFTEKLIFAY